MERLLSNASKILDNVDKNLETYKMPELVQDIASMKMCMC